MAEKNPLPGEYADAMTAQGVPADALTVVTERAEVEQLAQALQTKLTALGVTDLAEEGTLVLAGTVEITPGFVRGVRSMAPIAFDTSADLDLDSFPEMFDYTRAGRAAGAPRPLTAVASARSTSGGAGPVSAPAAPSAGGLGLTHVFSNGGGRTLVALPSADLARDEFILVADVLQLQSGTDIVIGSSVNYFTIIARDISIGAGVKVVWEPIDAPEHGTKSAGPDGRNFDPFVESPSSSFSSPSGGVGLPGHGGSIGLNGESAPTVEIWALTLDRLPEFELQGHVGGRGQTGAGGGDGGDGCKGAHSEAFVLCLSGPGYGGDGGDGGDGGRGGQGGVGGRGGTVKLLTTDAAHEAVLEAGVAINIAGGPGGPGGFGGQGGSGGRGGEAGDAALPCFAEAARAGSDGSDGTDGGLGTPGRQGAVGAFSAIVITEQEFIEKWTAPQIRSITPLSAAIGDTVTIDGGNFVAGASVAFDGVPAVTTFVASTILQAVVPAVTVGQVGVLVTIPGGAVSNPANLTVHPGIASITPSPAALGTTITISGDGFDSGSVVLFRGEELQPTTIAPDGSSLQVFLPAPDGPYEEPGGEETISVRGSDWTATAEAPLTIRHVLSTGFDVTRHAYGFTNNLGAINGVASLGTFEQTYGAVEVAAEFLLEPVMTGAWFAYYLSFFNGALPPGYSSGFSITAADQYWNGNQNLITDVATLGAVEPLLTVAQGRILSQELLDMLAWQANTPDRAELTLNEIEAVFEDQLRESPEVRRRMAPISQLMPAGSIASSGFAQRLSVSHGLLPIRIEYPAPEDGFYRRLVVYDNAPSAPGATAEAVVEYTGTPGNLSFNIFPVDATGALLLRFPDARNSSTGFTLSHVPLSLCWDVDVSLPRDFVFLFVPGPVLPGPVRTTPRPAPALVVEDAQKRRFGTDGRRGWDDLPGAAAAIGAPGLYLLPLERDLRFTIHGTEASSYTLGIVSRSLGTSLTLVDVPIGAGARDTVEIAESLRRVTVATGEAQKKLALHYGVEGVGLARAVAIEDLGIGRNAPLTLHADRDLGTFQLEGRGSAQAAAVSLSAAVDGEMRRREVGSIPIGGGLTRGFAVDWEPLELRALGETPGLPERDRAPGRRG